MELECPWIVKLIYMKGYVFSTFLEMMNRTRRYMDRYCSSDMKARECATDYFGATYIGRNWQDILKKVSKVPNDQHLSVRFPTYL